jgi:pimeloyl-ACP methyl ester carboxylesterase
MTDRQIIEAHRRAGRALTVAGVQSFVREEGEGPAVVCVHGMWGSSFLYRRLVHELAGRGLRGIAFDLPGFALAERPAGFDYTWTGLGAFARAAVDRLGLDRFHLVVHDIGGPVGFELAASEPRRIASLTMLNTVIDVTEFVPPWTMRPFRHRGLGELWLAALNRPMFRYLMRLQGIGDPTAVSDAELDAYLRLAMGPDRGRTFLKIARGAQSTADKQARYRAAVREVPYPVQIVWGADDPAMPLATYGRRAQTITGAPDLHTVPAKHFPQVDQAPAVAEHIATIAAASRKCPPP